MSRLSFSAYIFTFVVSFFFIQFITFGQNSVGIGTEDPNENAVLQLVSPNNDQGFLVPKLTTAQRTATAFTDRLGSGENGLLVFDSDENQFYYWEDSQWLELSSGLILTAGSGIDISGNVISNSGDSDNDPQNEIQDLQLTGNVLSVTNNGSATPIDLSGLSGGLQTLSVQKTGSNVDLDISDGNTVVVNVDDADADPANEIQDISLTGADLSITSGSTVDLSVFLNTDNQVAGAVPVTPAGNLTSTDVQASLEELQGDIDADGDADPTNEFLTGGTLNVTDLEITDGGGTTVVDLSSLVDDADADPINEIQNISISGNAISISNGGTGFNLSPVAPTPGYVLKWNGTQWQADPDATAAGSTLPVLGNAQIVTNNGSNVAVSVSGDLNMNNAGVMTIQPDAVTSAEILDGTVDDGDISGIANISASKLESLVVVEGEDLSLLTNGPGFISDLSSFTTDDLIEGSTNLYYTDARVDTRIAAASVTDLSDVTSAGSGAIITTAERTTLGNAIQDLSSVLTQGNDAGALSVQNLGNVGIGFSGVPSTELDIAGTASMTGFQLTTTPVSNYVLTSDASGNGTWQAIPSQFLSLNEVPRGDGTGMVSSNIFSDGTNTGIGNPPGAYKLLVDNSSEATSLRLENSNSTNFLRTLSLTTFAVGSSGRQGIYNQVLEPIGDANGSIAIRNDMTPQGTGSSYMVYNQMDGVGSGTRFGVLNNINADPSNGSRIYGERSNISHDGTGDSYGNYISQAGAGSGIKYGYYATGEDINYFSGNVGIGTTTPTTKLEVNGTLRTSGFQLGTSATSGYVLTTDASGVGTWQAIPSQFSTANNIPKGDGTGLTGSSIYDDAAGNVGFGTATPNAGLHSTSDNGILFSGTFGSGSTPTSSVGTRFMWYPQRAALQSGRFVTAGNVADIAIGDYSINMGFDGMANGEAAVSIGYGNDVTGARSAAIGNANTVTSQNAYAFGWINNANGDGALALGYLTDANGDNSVTLGRNLNADGIDSHIIGSGVNNASEFTNAIDNSLMVGFNSTVPTFFVGPSSGAGTTGNVGIGTSSPATKLEVNGTLRTSGFQLGTSSTSGYVLTTDVSGIGTWQPGALTIINNDPPNQNLYAGSNAGSALSSGTSNTFYGEDAGTSTSTETDNTFIGANSGLNNTASGNTFLGSSAGQANTTGTGNTFLGTNAGLVNTDGTDNIFIGEDAGSGNISGLQNTYIGFQAGMTGDGARNTFVGYQAGTVNASIFNTFIGGFAGALNTSGNRNVFIGAGAGGSNTTGNFNTFVGWEAAYANVDGIENTCIGKKAGNNNVSGSFNTMIGQDAGQQNLVDNNTFIGRQAGSSNFTGTENVFVGASTGGLSTDNSQIVLLGFGADASGGLISNAVAIGVNADVTASNTMVIGNSTNGLNVIPGTNGVNDFGGASNRWKDIYATNANIITSDRRLKNNIASIHYGLNEILSLNPVEYTWKNDEAGEMKLGLIAQEVQDLIPEVVNVGDDENATLGMRYTDLIPVLIKAIQDQQEIITALKDQNEKNSQRIDDLESSLEGIVELIGNME